MSDDAAAVVVIADVDLATAPGTSVGPLPRYVVTDGALVHAITARGSRPALSARALTEEEVDRLRAAASTLGAGADAGTGRGVEVSVVDADGILRVIRRSANDLGPVAEFVDEVRDRSERGEVLDVRAAGVVAFASARSDEDDAVLWPAPERPLVAGECVEVRGDEGAAVLDVVDADAWEADGFATVRFSQAGERFDVRLRPLVLAEQPCPQPAA